MIIAGPFCNDDCIAGIDICRSQCESARALRESAAKAVTDTFDKELGSAWSGNQRRVVDDVRLAIRDALEGIIEDLILTGKVERTPVYTEDVQR